MEQQNILDKTCAEINRQVWFDNEHKLTVCSIWPVATRFLWKGIKGFRTFPYIAFMSPEPDSGKSRALDVIGGLSYNPIKRGKYTPAVLLRYVDLEWKKHKRIFWRLPPSSPTATSLVAIISTSAKGKGEPTSAMARLCRKRKSSMPSVRRRPCGGCDCIQVKRSLQCILQL